MHHKKLIPGFVCRDGKTFSLLGHPFCDSAEELGLFSGSTGADALLFADGSRTDEDHEAVIGTLRKTVRAADIPVLAGGRVRRLEDVKKYLYAGAESVFLDAAEESNVDLLKEASDRFGSERIGICLPDPSYENRLEEYAQLGASYAILLSPGPLSEADSLPIPVFPVLRQESEEAAAAMLKAPSCGGLILTEGWGRESGAGSCMEWKHRLKRHQADVDLFESTLSWDAFHPGPGGLIPVIVQDYKTAEVLMLAYMNQEAFQKTLDTGKMTYYSRSRQCLWVKGETSGHTQYVKSLHLDCDNDTLLAKVHQIGAACHTGSRSCFYQTLVSREYRDANPLKVFEEVMAVIQDRKEHPKEGSYTNYLFDKGLDKILKKVGEEAAEIIIASKNPDPEEIKYEISDFLYHMMVLMAYKNISWEEIMEELASR